MPLPAGFDPLSRGRSWLWLVLLAFLVLMAFAPLVFADTTAPASPGEPPATAEPATAEPAAEGANVLLDSTRRSVRSTTEWLARGVDSWFGNRPFDDGGKISDGRLSLTWLQRQDQGSDVDVRFNVHVRLPNVERFAYVFIGRDDSRDVVTDTPGAFSRQQRLLRDRSESPSFVAGLGASLPNAIDLRIGFRGGLKPYAQARYKHNWAWDVGTLVDFRETVFWARDERFGSTTVLSFEQPLSPTLALRWLNATTITQELPEFAWSSNLGAYRSFGDQRLLSLEVLVNGTRGSGVGMSDYGVQVKWEQPIYRDWLLAELLAGHFWPRPDALSERGKAWAVGAALKMQF